jgi:nitrite reductase (NADH) small subunit
MSETDSIPAFIRIAPLGEVRPNRPVVRELNGHEIALFNIDGIVHAVSNVCPHQKAPVISEGTLDGSVISCPMHGWSFDLVTGLVVNGSGRIRRYETKVEGDEIMIREPEKIDPEW